MSKGLVAGSRSFEVGLCLAVLSLFLFPTLGQPATAIDSLFAEGVPESPAFVFLGATPAKVITPGSTKDLGLALVQGFDDSGRVREGFALDIVPIFYLPRNTLPIDLTRYRKLGWYALANLKLSLAAVQSQGDSGSTDIAFGLRTTLMDRGDPLLDSEYCHRAVGVFKVPEHAHGDLAQQLAENDTLFQNFREEWLKDHQGAFSIQVGGAFGYRAPQSRWSRRDRLGWGAWASIGGKFRKVRSIWLIAQVRYDQRDSIVGQAASNDLTYGGRIFLGQPRRYAFLEVIADRRVDPPAGSDRSFGHWSGGIEFRVSNDLWLSTGFGSTFANLEEPSRIAIIANIKWAITSEGRLKVLRPAGRK